MLMKIFCFEQYQLQPPFILWFALWTCWVHSLFVHNIAYYEYCSRHPSSLKTSLVLLWDVKHFKHRFHRKITMRITSSLVLRTSAQKVDLALIPLTANSLGNFRCSLTSFSSHSPYFLPDMIHRLVQYLFPYILSNLLIFFFLLLILLFIPFNFFLSIPSSLIVYAQCPSFFFLYDSLY